MKKIEELEQEISKLIEDRLNKKEEEKEILQKNQDEINNLISKRTKAEQDNDFKTFNKIKKEIDEKEKEKEFSKNRLNQLEKPLYTGDEYFSKIEEIEESIVEEIDELYQQAKPLVDELEKLLLRERRISDKANNLIEVIREEALNGAIILNGRGTNYTVNKPLKAFQYANDSVQAVLYRRK